LLSHSGMYGARCPANADPELLPPDNSLHVKSVLNLTFLKKYFVNEFRATEIYVMSYSNVVVDGTKAADCKLMNIKSCIGLLAQFRPENIYPAMMKKENALTCQRLL